MSRILIIFFIIAIVIIGLVYVGKGSLDAPLVSDPIKTEATLRPEHPIFTKKVSELGLDISAFSGFMDISPDNTYMMIGGVNPTGTESTDPHMYVVDFNTNSIAEVPKNPLGRWINSEHKKAFIEEDKIQIYNFADGSINQFPETSSVFSGSFSPDEKQFVYNTQQGIRIFDLESAEVTSLSTKQYDGAYAWFSDSTRILGFRQNSLDVIQEAGFGRILSIWNTKTGQVEELATIDMPSSSLRFIEWIVQDKIARVNAGYDDGSFDYIVNIETGFVTDLGDTSGMLQNGVRVDQDLSRIALVGMKYEETATEGANSAEIFDEKGTSLNKVVFEDTDSRQSVQFIDKDTLIYLKKKETGNKDTQVVSLDINTGNERILYTVSGEWISSLQVTKDKEYFIIAPKDQVVIERL